MIGSLKSGTRDKTHKGHVSDDGSGSTTTTVSKNVDEEMKQKLKKASAQLKG